MEIDDNKLFSPCAFYGSKGRNPGKGFYPSNNCEETHLYVCAENTGIRNFIHTTDRIHYHTSNKNQPITAWHLYKQNHGISFNIHWHYPMVMTWPCIQKLPMMHAYYMDRRC